MTFILAILAFFNVVTPHPDNTPYAWCKDFASVAVSDQTTQSSDLILKAHSRKTGTIAKLEGCGMVIFPAPKSSGHYCAFDKSKLTLSSGELKVTPWSPLFKYEDKEIRPTTLTVKAGETYKPTTNPARYQHAGEHIYAVLLETVNGPVSNIQFDFVCE